MSIDDYLINFEHYVAKLKHHNILLPELILTYKALESLNLTPENEQLVKAIIWELILTAISKQLRKIMHRDFYNELSSNTPSVVKKDVNFAYNENNDEGPNEVFYNHLSNWHPSCFSSQVGSVTRSKIRHKKNFQHPTKV